tara:strand:+ start:1364 stop:2332 length:969 start_codon:yes stop_codon:yes gene_type:complete
MEFLKKNKLTSIIAGVIILLLIVNVSLNTYATSKIEDELKSVTKDFPNFKYEDISYSFISSTLSFENLYIGEDDEWVKAESLTLKINPEEFPTKEEFEKMDFEIDLSDSELIIENLKLVDDDNILKLKSLSYSFNGSFNYKEETLNSDNLNINLEGLDVSTRKEDLSLDKLEIEFRSSDFINLNPSDFEDQLEKITDLNDLYLDINIENYNIPRAITRELDLDDFGIRKLTGNIIKFEMEKDDEEIDFDFQFGSNSLGSVDLEVSLDISEDIDNPNIKLELTLEDLNKDLNRMLQKAKLDETDNGFSLEFDGTVNELTRSLF